MQLFTGAEQKTTKINQELHKIILQGKKFGLEILVRAIKN